MQNINLLNERILRLPEVIERVSLSRSAIYELIDRGEFPDQINLGNRSVGWIESEINTWIKDRIAKSRR